MEQQRVCLITGANTGIGRVTARELARDGYAVYIAGRSRQRTEPVIKAIRQETGNSDVGYLPLDLGDLSSVRACADAFLALEKPLHLLINNAGIAGMKGATFSGFEMAFGVNHVGHFLLTQLLVEKLKASAPARVVILASKAHRRVRGLDWAAATSPTQTLFGVREYSASKLANVLHAAELGRRLQGSGVTTYAVHPGVVQTEIWRYVKWPLRPLIIKLRKLITVEEGALTTLHCARAPQRARETGLYYSDSQPEPASEAGQDMALARELFERSEQWVGVKSVAGEI